MSLEGPSSDRQEDPSLKQKLSLKEQQMQTEGEEVQQYVDEDAVDRKVKAVESRIGQYDLGEKYQTIIRGKLDALKGKWATKIDGIEKGANDQLTELATQLNAELDSFNEQDEVKEIYKVVEPFFRQKEKVVSVISLDTYKRGSGDWKAINKQLNALGIKNEDVSALQTYLGIEPDGAVGPETITHITEMYGNKKEVKFDSETTLSADGGSEFKTFDEYRAKSEKLEKAFQDPRWQQAEQASATAYEGAKTVKDITAARGEEIASKVDALKAIMGEDEDQTGDQEGVAEVEGDEEAAPAAEALEQQLEQTVEMLAKAGIKNPRKSDDGKHVFFDRISTSGEDIYSFSIETNRPYLIWCTTVNNGKITGSHDARSGREADLKAWADTMIKSSEKEGDSDEVLAAKLEETKGLLEDAGLRKTGEGDKNYVAFEHPDSPGQHMFYVTNDEPEVVYCDFKDLSGHVGTFDTRTPVEELKVWADRMITLGEEELDSSDRDEEAEGEAEPLIPEPTPETVEIVAPTPEEMKEIMQAQFGELLNSKAEWSRMPEIFGEPVYEEASNRIVIIYPSATFPQNITFSYSLKDKSKGLKFSGEEFNRIVYERGCQKLIDEWEQCNGKEYGEGEAKLHGMEKSDSAGEQSEKSKGEDVKKQIEKGERSEITKEEFDVLMGVLKKQKVLDEVSGRDIELSANFDVNKRLREDPMKVGVDTVLDKFIDPDENSSPVFIAAFNSTKKIAQAIVEGMKKRGKTTITVPTPHNGDIVYNTFTGLRVFLGGSERLIKVKKSPDK